MLPKNDNTCNVCHLFKGTLEHPGSGATVCNFFLLERNVEPRSVEGVGIHIRWNWSRQPNALWYRTWDLQSREEKSVALILGDCCYWPPCFISWAYCLSSSSCSFSMQKSPCSSRCAVWEMTFSWKLMCFSKLQLIVHGRMSLFTLREVNTFMIETQWFFLNIACYPFKSYCKWVQSSQTLQVLQREIKNRAKYSVRAL